ncbi:MAG: hypothetical protein AAF570_16145, partial [Bacteroidota bacterium]
SNNPNAFTGAPDVYAYPESSEWQISNYFDRVLKGEPELDFLCKNATDYVFEQLEDKQHDPQKMTAALQMVLQSSHAEALMQAWERDYVTVPFGETSESIDWYALPDRAMGAWTTGFFFGMICRADTQRKNLNFLPYTRHFINHEVLGEFRLIYYHFLRTLGSEMSQIFYDRAAYALSKIPAEYAESYKATFPLWQPIMDGSKDGLETVLSHCLYERKLLLSDRMRRDADIAIMGILSYAHDIGLEIPGARYPHSTALVRGEYKVDLHTDLDFNFPPEPPKERQSGIRMVG